jgi:hypothetical protein
MSSEIPRARQQRKKRKRKMMVVPAMMLLRISRSYRRYRELEGTKQCLWMIFQV